MPNLVSPTRPSFHILGKTPDFQISGQSFIKKNCHNSRTSNNIDLKLGPVTKLDKRNMTTFDDDVMSINYLNVIVIFPIYGQFGAVWKLDSERMVCETDIFINSNFFLNKD